MRFAGPIAPSNWSFFSAYQMIPEHCLASQRGGPLFHNDQASVTNFRTDYAKDVDFCVVLDRNMKAFYLLAFLLTANHRDAERCFGAVVEDIFKENCVFKAWAESWVKRCLIKKAIQFVLSRSSDDHEDRNLWCEKLGAPQLTNTVNAVTGLKSIERLVFVVLILEGYSTKECSLLLDFTMERVVQLRARALRGVAATDPYCIGTPARRSRESA